MRKPHRAESPADLVGSATQQAAAADDTDRMMIAAFAMHGLLIRGRDFGDDQLADQAVKKAEALLARLNHPPPAAGKGG